MLPGVGVRGYGLGFLLQFNLVSVLLKLFIARSFTRGIAVANIMGSRSNRPLVNIGIVRGKAAGNSVASISNGCDISMGKNGAVLIFSCVNCVSRRVPIKGRGALGIAVGRSARRLRRIIIVNCNATGGGSLAKTVSAIGTRDLRGRAPHSIRSLLETGTPNISVKTSIGTRNATSIRVHNGGALDTKSSPLCILSNIVFGNSLSSVGPVSIRSVSILGSTDSITMCNTGTTGKIVTVAAGGNGANGPIIGFGSGFK